MNWRQRPMANNLKTVWKSCIIDKMKMMCDNTDTSPIAIENRPMHQIGSTSEFFPHLQSELPR